MATIEPSEADWLLRLDERYAITRSERYPDPVVLHDYDKGAVAFDNLGLRRDSAIVRVDDGLSQRWRRRLPGPWLVTRGSQGGRAVHTAWTLGHQSEDWVTRTYGYLTAGAAREIRPSAALRAALDDAACRDMTEQLSSCGLNVVGVDPHSQDASFADARFPGVLVTHHRDNDTVDVTGGDRLAVWDSTVIQRVERRWDAPTSWNAPKGLRADFAVNIDDLVTFHPRNIEGESSAGIGRWRFPSPHFHTADGRVICTAEAGWKTDKNNVPLGHDSDYVSPV